MKEEIRAYYNKLAKDYDQSRFANSYGQFIHSQEIKILNNYLDKNPKNVNLDVACGTGRFLEYASHGIDVSEEMLKIARSKYPQLDLQVSAAEALPFEDGLFDNVLSFHLMMHLDKASFNKILQEVDRVTKRKGYFIFDIPSEKRRKLTRYAASSWHGGNELSIDYVKKCLSNSWDLVDYQGVSFFPLHRIPKSFRNKIRPIDNYLCRSLCKEYSSYLVLILQKK